MIQQILDISQVVFSPFFIAITLYLAVPTLLRRFRTTNLYFGLVNLCLALAAILAGLEQPIGLAIYSVGGGILIFCYFYWKARKMLKTGEKQIYVQFFFADPPEYGTNFLEGRKSEY